jgi:hypothetical protein
MAQKNKLGQYLYFTTSPAALMQLGIAGDLIGIGYNSVAKYNPIRLLQKAPFNYNDTSTDSTGYSSSVYYGQKAGTVYIDSFRVRKNVMTNTIYDGYGTLKTPIKTYPSVGRIKTHESSADSIDAYIGTSSSGPFQWKNILGSVSETDHYLWFTSNIKASIVEISVDGTGTPIAANYLLDAATGITPILKSTTINVYPNPAIDEVSIDYANNSDVTLTIYNSLGQLITQHPVTANSITKLNVSNYATGIYMYRLIDKSNEMLIGTGRFSVVK